VGIPFVKTLSLLLAILAPVPLLAKAEVEKVFAKDNLVAWCIVPFDAKKRGPIERADMAKRLGFTKIAFDWRGEHVPSFEQEILEYKKHNIEFYAFWSWHDSFEPLIKKHGIKPQIWKTLGSPKGATQEAKVDAAAKSMLPLVKKCEQLGLKLGLYNHGGWGGEPANLVSVCQELHKQGHKKVGIVYNFHHGHEHVEDFKESLQIMKPYLLCLNLNGMLGKNQQFQKILPIGRGADEPQMLKEILEVDYEGPIGILGHVASRDVEIVLKENLKGLRELTGKL
jgi:hypothetical protein